MTAEPALSVSVPAPSTTSIDQENKSRSSFDDDLRSLIQSESAKGTSKHASVLSHRKNILFIGMLIVPYAILGMTALPLIGQLALWSIMGVAIAALGFNLGHDALHGAYRKCHKQNGFLGCIFDVVGASSYFWRSTHNKLHHGYTNELGKDEDLTVSPLFRTSQHLPHEWFHRYQHLYAIPLYATATLNWLLVKDFQYLYRGRVLQDSRFKISNRSLKRMLIGKALSVAWMILIPTAFFPMSLGQALLGFLVMQLTAGLILGLVFQVAHLVPEVVVYGEKEAENVPFFEQQLRTTANFSVHNRLMTEFTGGLNHQIEHHLFPQFSNEKYSKLAGQVQALAQKHGVPYVAYPDFWTALKAHLRYMKSLSRA